MRDSETKHCQSWGEHFRVTKVEAKSRRKRKIIHKYRNGEASLNSTAAEAGVDRETLQRWVVQYAAEGVAAFLPKRRNQIYSPQLKLQAVQDYLSGGGSLLDVSKKYGLRDKRQLRDFFA